MSRVIRLGPQLEESFLTHLSTIQFSQVSGDMAGVRTQESFLTHLSTIQFSLNIGPFREGHIYTYYREKVVQS